MPQLDTSTFASQIFWVLVGFFLVYLFVSKIFVPKIEKILQNRNAYISDMLMAARQLEDSATLMEEDAFITMENAQMDAVAAETEFLTAFREQSLNGKNLLYSLFSKKTKQESDMLKKSTQEAYIDVESQMDELTNLAIENILNSDRQAS